VVCGPLQAGINDALGLGPDTIDFRFRFSAESPALRSVAHTVSAECVTSLSAYFRFLPFRFRSTSIHESNCLSEPGKGPQAPKNIVLVLVLVLNLVIMGFFNSLKLRRYTTNRN